MQFKETRSIYLQIADYICEQILKNMLASKERLPSVRDLAIELQVNPNTIVKSYNYLETQQIISMQRGIGYFITDNAKSNIVKLKKDSFLKTELPDFFKTLNLLSIEFKEIEKHYQQYGKKHEKK